MLISNDDPDYYRFIDESRKGLELMVNEEFYFYGVFNNIFKIDDMLLEVLEDPCDGYRSSMGAVCHYASVDDMIGHYHKRPLGKVILESMDDVVENHYSDPADDDEYVNHSMDGYRLRDVETNHIWLYFGTNNTCNYYPYFVFKYKPDKTQKDYIVVDENYLTYKDRFPEDVLRTIGWFNGDRIEYRQY